MARQLTERRSPLHSATPMVDPVMHMVVETGRPYCDARMTVIEAPSSMEKPREGDMSVILLPRTFMLRRGDKGGSDKVVCARWGGGGEGAHML